MTDQPKLFCVALSGLVLHEDVSASSLLASSSILSFCNINTKTAEILDIIAYDQTLQPVIGWEWYPALGFDSQHRSSEAMFTRWAGCYLHLMVKLHFSSMRGCL